MPRSGVSLIWPYSTIGVAPRSRLLAVRQSRCNTNVGSMPPTMTSRPMNKRESGGHQHLLRTRADRATR